jgi:hypothetical protein
LFESLFETAEEKWEIISQEAYLIKHLYLSLYLSVASDFVLNLKSGVEFEAALVELNKTENGVPCCAEHVAILTLRFLLYCHIGASRACVCV